MPIGNQTAAVGVAAGPRIVPAGVRSASPAAVPAPDGAAPQSLDQRQRVSATQWWPGVVLNVVVFDGPALNARWAVEHISVAGVDGSGVIITVFEGDPRLPGAVMLGNVPTRLDASLTQFTGSVDYPRDLVIMGGAKLAIVFDNCLVNRNVFATVQFRAI